MKLWNIAPHDTNAARKISSEYGLPGIVAALLQIRGVTTENDIRDFLFNEGKIAPPLGYKDMDKAAERIGAAIENGEKICVYGDYDADGVTSTALLYSYLEAMGADVIYYIPSRETEGYGMNNSAIDKLSAQGVRLIVTVDNGISAAEQIDHALSLGIETVVTDHHMPPEKLPNACAVVDPCRSDCDGEFKGLSGVGVAFKLIMALEGEDCDVDYLLENYSDLLSIGTVADVMKLKGDNRVFVKRGLAGIAESDRPGIRALLRHSGLENRAITASSISFNLAPRINAVGRLGFSGDSVKLLITGDEREATEIAVKMCEDNSERQQIQNDILKCIDYEVRRNPSLVYSRIIVIAGDNWRQGVVGIVAARIREIYGKPAIIITKTGELAAGSGRSVEGFSFVSALRACSDLLEKFGGHDMAGGLTIKTENIELFRKRINDYAASLDEMPFDCLNIDCKLNPALIDLELVKDLSMLEPFGVGNPTPVFGFYNMTLIRIVPFGNNKHIKLLLKRNDTIVEMKRFGIAPEQFPYNEGETLDIAASLEVNEFAGRVSVSYSVRAVKSSLDDPEDILRSQRVFEDFCSGISSDKEALCKIIPDRNDFAAVYRFLKAGFCRFDLSAFPSRLENKLSMGKIRVALEAMSELGLIEINEGLNDCRIILRKTSGKVNLEDAEIMKKLREAVR
ncbi:MAG: single-stranded-DNA-specific exonuclease RecJ [Ruminococcus sp.]|nr:single-stranded-DNA-specific exonuclease RecJ [Ruminococcus sp.]